MQSYKSPPQELPRQQPTCEMESAGFAGGFAPMARIPQPENAKLYHQRQLPVHTFFHSAARSQSLKNVGGVAHGMALA